MQRTVPAVLAVAAAVLRKPSFQAWVLKCTHLDTLLPTDVVELSGGDSAQRVTLTRPCHSQMSKSFDEGGARGMLLNQLSVQEGCRLAFDSVDATDVDGLVCPTEGPLAFVPRGRAFGDTFDCRDFASKLGGVLDQRLCPQLELVYERLEACGVDTACTVNWQNVSFLPLEALPEGDEVSAWLHCGGVRWGGGEGE